jgi:cytidine deaminase
MSDDSPEGFPRPPAAVTDADLLAAARDAVTASYAPYSDYGVGAALLTVDGDLFTGVNVENANYSNSLHAEEVAVGSAVAAGHREFDRIAVAAAAEDGVLPCGMCRQTLAEFCGEGFRVVCEAGDRADGAPTDPVGYRLGDLLPDAIGASDLGVEGARGAGKRDG